MPEKDLKKVKAELPNHIENTRQESGCVIFEVKEDQENKNRFNVYEEFANQEAFDSHQQRVAASRWGQVTKDVRRSYRIKSAPKG